VHAFIMLSEEGPNTSLSWILWVTLGFFFLMVVVGWLVSRSSGNQTQVVSKKIATRKSGDDLTILEGIGPKVEKILNDAGYLSFADLAKAKTAEVDKVLDAAGLQMMDSAGWIEQAQLASKGDMKGLAKLQEELKGGRKVH
jgi:hypothetical protein